MDRREFVKGTALTVAGVALKPLNASVNSKREFVVENRQLAWRLATTANGIRSVGLENRMSAREFPLQVEDEFKLIFSAGTRIEIPWWDFCLTDGGSVVPEQERGLAQGFHQSTKEERAHGILCAISPEDTRGRTTTATDGFAPNFGCPNRQRDRK